MREHRVDSPPPREATPPVSDTTLMELELAAEPTWTARAGRRTSRDKFAAGMRGLKHAVRGDSSFFAHAYRGTLIAMTAALLGVDPLGWCFLVISASFVMLAEVTHSAIDTLARASGNEEETPYKMAREIAAGGVVIAAFASGGLTITVLVVKFGEMFGWWRN